MPYLTTRFRYASIRPRKNKIESEGALNVPSERVLRLSCPNCLARLSWQQIDLSSSFRCSECGQDLVISRSYFRYIYLLSVSLISLTAYASGARHGVLASVILLGIVPVFMIVNLLARILFPPYLRLKEDYLLNLSAQGREAHVLTGRTQTERFKKDRSS
jgi:hypothetical protein